MSGFDNLKLRTSSDGNSIRSAKINDARHMLRLEEEYDTSYCSSMFFWVPGVSPCKGESVGLRVYDRKYSAANGVTQKFLSLITNKIDIGDYLYNEEDDTYWLCTESFNVNSIHFQGKLTECNWFLRWQRSDGTILEYPCQDINSTQYNSGESGNTTMTLGTAQHMEKVQATADTIILTSPQRFFISKTDVPYVITQNDTTSSNYGKGICNITVTQDLLNPNDDIELGICDYFTPTTPLPPPTQETDLIASIKYSGSNNIYIGGNPKTFIAVLHNQSGDKQPMSPLWTVTPEFPGLRVTTIDEKLILSCDDYNLDQEMITITVRDEKSGFRTSIDLLLTVF
jgi:hypothetical protein